jgi:hypothetical protein
VKEQSHESTGIGKAHLPGLQNYQAQRRGAGYLQKEPAP